jgi:hypothetical protein
MEAMMMAAVDVQAEAEDQHHILVLAARAGKLLH